MNLALDDIAGYLGGTMTVPIQKGTIIEVPDNVVALRATGGMVSQHVLGTGPGQAILDEPTIQVLTRAKDYQTGMQLALDARALLDGLRDIVLNGLLYHFVRALQPPFFLQRDENQRYLFAFNVHVQRRNEP